MSLPKLDIVSEILENEIFVKIIHDVESFDLQRYSLGPFKKDESVVLDRWQGEILIQHGYAHEINLLNENEIAKCFWEDHKQQNIVELPSSFYINLYKTLKELSETSISNKKFYQVYSKTIRDARSLLEIRTKKIVDTAVSQKKLEKDTMQNEEKILYSHILSIIREWKKYQDKVLLGSDE